jgi:hypothetical protein
VLASGQTDEEVVVIGGLLAPDAVGIAGPRSSSLSSTIS